MADLQKVVVVTGFAEVWSQGNSRTGWEMEAYGKFSLEGCTYMAWIIGLIKHLKIHIKGNQCSGWVGFKTGEPLEDKDIKPKYEKYILEHSGIGFIELHLFNGNDPKKEELLVDVVIEHYLESFKASKETAEEFKSHNRHKVEIFEIIYSGQHTAPAKKKRAIGFIPKALKFDPLMAGKIPPGWDKKKHGVPDDILSQVDQITL